MTEQPEVRASAGAAAVSGVAADFSEWALTLDDSVPLEYGVRFTSEYEPGGDYPPAPPPPAEVQHQRGLHQADEEA